MFAPSFEYGDPRDRETVGQRKQRKVAEREGSVYTNDSGERSSSPPASARKPSSSSASSSNTKPPSSATSQKPKSRFGFFSSRSKDNPHEKKTSLPTSERDTLDPEPKISLNSLDSASHKVQKPIDSPSNNSNVANQPTLPSSENDISRQPPMPPPSFPVPPTPNEAPNSSRLPPFPTATNQRIATDLNLRPIMDTSSDYSTSSPRTTRMGSGASGWTESSAATSAYSPQSQMDNIDQSLRTFYIGENETNYKFRKNNSMETKPHPIHAQPRSGGSIPHFPNSGSLPPYNALGYHNNMLDVDSKSPAGRTPSRMGDKHPPPASAGRSSFQSALVKMENAGLKIMFKRLSEDWRGGANDSDNTMLEEVAFEQRLWALVAAEWLTFGKALQSDAHEYMLEAHVQDGRRLLHLHGSAADGWVLAAKYPNVTVYSVSSQDISNPPCAWPAPLNHHALFLPQSNSPLPFPDNYFDVISTKSFSSILRTTDWVPLLKECNRVLRPGGWVELQIIDPVLTKQGELLRDWLDNRILREMIEDNYAIKPSDDVLGYLQETGFDSVRRSRIALPASFNPKLRNIARGQGPDPDAARVMVLVGRHFYEELYSGFNPITNKSGGDQMWWQNKAIKHECEALNTCFGLTFAFGQKI